jgi:phosphoenolpyruvate phosphomutase
MAVRASVAAMRKTFAQIRKDGGIHGVESQIATVDEVFDLQGMAR